MEKESPIEQQRLGKLVAQAWGYRNGKNERQFVLDHTHNFFEETKFGTFVWENSLQKNRFNTFYPSKKNHRKIDEIHPRELIFALQHVLEALGPLDRDEAAKVLSKQFGINRMTQKVKDHLQKIIIYAIQQNQVISSKEKITVPKK